MMAKSVITSKQLPQGAALDLNKEKQQSAEGTPIAHMMETWSA